NRHGLQADRGGPVTLAGGQRAPSRGARPRRREVQERQTRRTARRHHRYRGGRIKDLDPQVLTIALWHRRYVKKLSPELSRLTYNKLVLINAAESINDLRVPPGSRLEKLSGNRAGQYSVRVNDQWRICFTWSTSGAGNVELVDYH